MCAAPKHHLIPITSPGLSPVPARTFGLESLEHMQTTGVSSTEQIFLPKESKCVHNCIEKSTNSNVLKKKKNLT